MTNEECFDKVIILDASRNAMHLNLSLLSIFKASVTIVNKIFTVFVNDFLWHFDPIESASQKIIFFVLKESEFLISVFAFDSHLWLSSEWIFSRYIMQRLVSFLFLNLLKCFDISDWSSINRVFARHDLRSWKIWAGDIWCKRRDIDDQNDSFVQFVSDKISELNYWWIWAMSRIINRV